MHDSVIKQIHDTLRKFSSDKLKKNKSVLTNMIHQSFRVMHTCYKVMCMVTTPLLVLKITSLS